MSSAIDLNEVSRRDFIKAAAYFAALLGLEASWIGPIAEALEKKKKPVIIWLNFQSCTGCTESFLQSSHPVIKEIVLDLISLDFNETIQAAAGEQAEKALQDSMKNNFGQYILVVEGAVPTKDGGVYCTIAGRTGVEIVREAAKGAAAIITYGTCSSFGGVQAAVPNPTGARPISEIVSGKPMITVPGCPPIGEVMTGIVAHYLVFGKLPQLDSLGRPIVFYGKRIHDTCYRRSYFDAGIFAEKFGDPSGCLYKLGCKGPTTSNACAVLGWHEGTSFPIKSGHPCIGCSEPGFWDAGPFYRRLPEVPLTNVHTTVDKVGLALTGVTAAAFAAHGAVAAAKRACESLCHKKEEALKKTPAKPAPESIAKSPPTSSGKDAKK